MRKLEYLSPTAIQDWKKGQDEFYLTRLSEVRAPRFPQTQPMSIGSSFDAHVKSFLHTSIFGKGNDPKFDLVALFEAQVEPHNRDWAWDHGEKAFEFYRRSGALADLMVELAACVGTPRFEIEVKGVVSGHREGITREFGGVTFLGKPDVFYINRHGCHVVLDWKVNGWCGRGNTSPMPGYLRIRSGSGLATASGPHKDCIPMSWNGTTINTGQYLDQLNAEWAAQLAIYGWLVGVEVGQEFITAIDQLACKASGGKYPDVRVAEHRLRVHADFQWQVFAEAQKIWEIVHSDHIFRDLSLADSRSKCELLDARARSLQSPASESDAIFDAMTRGRD